MSGKRGANYKPTEDKVLWQSWLLVSGDASVGTNQTGDAFWEEVRRILDKDISDNTKGYVRDRIAKGLASRTVFPLDMHAIDVAEHSYKPPLRIVL
ncbi:hypothetical protein ON010_g12490 [Phytophthora cinnamomi]|nr:hypothetical protein ON010_g12490 [Phytophthora cinnamomi]